MAWLCQVCGYVHEGETPPEQCPICMVGAEMFRAQETDRNEAPRTGENWVCQVCGHAQRGKAPPEQCPVCAVGAEMFRPEEETRQPTASASDKRWLCQICGYVHRGASLPNLCPYCGVEQKHFKKVKPLAKAVTPIKIVIVGASAAGVSAAESARRHNQSAEITLIHGESGEPYHRMSLTPFLAGNLGEDALILKKKDWFFEKGIKLVYAQAKAIDLEAKHIHLTKGAPIAFDKLVLATGATPFIPPLLGVELKGVYAFRGVEDAKRILEDLARGFRSVAVIGGGVLGIEIAGACVKRGAQVMLLEHAPWLLSKQFAKSPATRLKGHLETLGISVQCGVSIGLKGQERVSEIIVSRERHAADLVVIAAGVRPRLALAKDAGISTAQGILVDEKMATSHPDVFAAGDVVEFDGRPQGLWMVAADQGRVAGINAAGGSEKARRSAAPTQLKVLDLPTFSVGNIHKEGEEVEIYERQFGQTFIQLLVHKGLLAGANLIGNSEWALSLKDAVENELPFKEIQVPIHGLFG